MVRFNLPDIEHSFRDFVNFFSFHNEQKQQPNRVFILTNELYKLCLRIAHPDDKAWTEYTFEDHMIQFYRAKSLLAIGYKVFCFDERGWLIMYDMVRNMW